MSVKQPKVNIDPFTILEGNGQHPVVTMICDATAPVLHRAAVLRDILNNINPETQVIAERIARAGRGAAERCFEPLQVFVPWAGPKCDRRT